MLSRIRYASLNSHSPPKSPTLHASKSFSARRSVDSRTTKNYHNFEIGTMIAVDSILAGKYPAKAHARRVVEYIKKSKPDAQGVLYLEGQKTRMIEDNDEAQPFR